MATTVVKDSQLRLDPIITQDPQVESTAPSLKWRETDRTISTDGLWRWNLEDGRMRLDLNTAAGGDFSTLEELINVNAASGISGGITFRRNLAIGGGATDQGFIRFTSTASTSTPNKSLGVNSDEKLFFTRGGINFIVLTTENIITRETPTGLLNGVNVTYVLANTPVSGTEHVYLNGILQDEGAGNDYTISAATITYAAAPISTDKIRVSYIK